MRQGDNGGRTRQRRACSAAFVVEYGRGCVLFSFSQLKTLSAVNGFAGTATRGTGQGGGDALAGLLEVVQGTLDLRDRAARLLEYRDGHLLLHEREVKVQRQIVRLQVDRLSHTSARVSQAYGSEGTLRRVARASAYFSASK